MRYSPTFDVLVNVVLNSVQYVTIRLKFNFRHVACTRQITTTPAATASTATTSAAANTESATCVTITTVQIGNSFAGGLKFVVENVTKIFDFVFEDRIDASTSANIVCGETTTNSSTTALSSTITFYTGHPRSKTMNIGENIAERWVVWI